MFDEKNSDPVEHMFVGLGEIKATADDEKGEMTFSGYGAVFGNVDSHGDVIAKGAFAETLKKTRRNGNWPALLSQHGGMFGSDSTPIGVWTDMKEDDVGLWVEGKFANTERGREAYELLKMKPRPAYNGLSIGFKPIDWSIRTKPDEPRRTLKKVDLMEVSLVTFPSNPKARVVDVKSQINPRELEDALRDAGLSRADSVKAVSVLKTELRREDGEPDTDPRDEEAAVEQRTSELVSLADRIRTLAMANSG